MCEQAVRVSRPGTPPPATPRACLAPLTPCSTPGMPLRRPCSLPCRPPCPHAPAICPMPARTPMPHLHTHLHTHTHTHARARALPAPRHCAWARRCLCWGWRLSRPAPQRWAARHRPWRRPPPACRRCCRRRAGAAASPRPGHTPVAARQGKARHRERLPPGITSPHKSACTRPDNNINPLHHRPPAPKARGQSPWAPCLPPPPTHTGPAPKGPLPPPRQPRPRPTHPRYAAAAFPCSASVSFMGLVQS